MNNLDLVKEFLRREDKAKTKSYVTTILAIVGAVAAVAAIAYFVYRYLNPEYLEDIDDYEEEYFEDFDDDYEDFFQKDEEPIVITSEPAEEAVEE